MVLVGMTPSRRHVAMFPGLGNWQCSITQRLPRSGASRSISSYIASTLSIAAPPAACTWARSPARATLKSTSRNVASDVCCTPVHGTPRAPTYGSRISDAPIADALSKENPSPPNLSISSPNPCPPAYRAVWAMNASAPRGSSKSAGGNWMTQ